MEIFLNFIENHNNYFKRYDKIDDIESITEEGWLYIFTAFCYDVNINKILPENTNKFGKTKQMLLERLKTYKKYVKMSNIEAIQCSLPCKRERLIKAYLKLRTPIRAVVGTEYFTKCRNLIKVLMLITLYISDEDIIKYEISYSNSKSDKNDTVYTELFDRIDKYIDKIKENNDFKIEDNIEETKPKLFKCDFCNELYNNLIDLKDHQNTNINCLDIQCEKTIDYQSNDKEQKNYACNFCNSLFISSNNLKVHQKTAKFCLQLQNKSVDETFLCNFCNKSFNLKSNFTNHILNCKDKKTIEEKEQLKELEKKLKELEKENNELKLKVSVKEELINELKKLNKELMKRPISTSIVNNNDNRQQNQYNLQFNQLFEKLPILNEENINNRINELSTEDKLSQCHFDNFYNESLQKIVYQLKDLSFCTDQSRKIVVIKDESENSVKMNAEEFLSKCFDYGSGSITNLINLTNQIVDSKIENCDPSLTSEMLDIFNVDRDNFLERIKNNKVDFFLTNNQTSNKIEASTVINYIKQLEKLNK